MKTCGNCGGEFGEKETALNAAEELGGMFLDNTGESDALELCPYCREELGMESLLGFDE